jgi:hypothetical protein
MLKWHSAKPLWERGFSEFGQGWAAPVKSHDVGWGGSDG